MKKLKAFSTGWKGIQMAFQEVCEFCQDDDVEMKAELKVVLNEKKCMANNISPIGNYFKDWAIYSCKKCYVSDGVFAEDLGVPEGDDYKEYFTVEHYTPEDTVYKAFKNYRKGLEDYTPEQMMKYITTWEDYKEWVYTHKIETKCDKPYCWYINTGEFIADEMRGQVIGLYRDKSETGWGDWQVMDKYDWRYMDEDNLQTYKGAIKKIMDMRSQQWDAEPEREYIIINLEQLENMEATIWMEKAITEYMERQAEIISDIKRGK